MNGQNVNESIGRQTDGCLDGWIGGLTNRRTMDVWMDGCMDHNGLMVMDITRIMQL